MTDEHPIGVALENRLMSNGIYLLSVTWGEATADGPATDDRSRRRPPDGLALSIEYETVSETAAVTTQEVSAVVRALLSIAAEREWTPGRLEVTSLTTNGVVRGHWHVERGWFDGLGSDLSEQEFSARVLDTRDNHMNEN